MAVRLVTGVPGSGKSFYAVHHLTSNYCTFDPIAGLWELKEGVTIYASLDGLRLQHYDVDELLKEYGPETVFSVEFWQERVREGQKTILIIDEAQRYLSSQRRYPDSVWYFFEYHRHLGLDIWLMSQSATSIHRRVLAVTDAYIEAAPPSLRLGGVFRYRRRDTTTNEVIGREHLKSDARVFAAYRSADHTEGLKSPRSVLVRYAVVALVLVVGGLIAAPILFARHYGAQKEQQHQEQTSVAPSRSKVALAPEPVLLAQTETDWRQLAYVGIDPYGTIPDRCRPYTTEYFRCGPLGTGIEGLPGTICRDRYCDILIRNRAAPAATPAARSVSEDGQELAGGGDGEWSL